MDAHDMRIDGDGALSSHGDKDYDHNTALQWHGKSANADEVPYVVGNPEDLGKIARVQYNGRTVYAVVADTGHGWGEASIRTAQAVGVPSSPVSGGVKSGVTYTLAPPGSENLRNLDHVPTFDEIQDAGRRAFGEKAN
jgi:hypothetical protein